MNKTITLLLGLAAGGVLAFAAYTKKGKAARTQLSKRVKDIKDDMSSTLERKARAMHDSGVKYS